MSQSDLSLDVVINFLSKNAGSAVGEARAIDSALKGVRQQGQSIADQAYVNLQKGVKATRQITALDRQRSKQAMGDWDREFAALSKVTAAKSTAVDTQSRLNDVSLRYAQYDMASTLLSVAAAMTTLGVASAVAFAKQEAAFTEVERILAGSGASRGTISALREDITGLSEEIPLAFSDLSNIAAFGAALDISADNLAAFTDVVGRFAALTGVTMEEAGKGIARIAQYTGTEGTRGYEKLGSAILKAGNISIATEQEVLRFSQALSPLASKANVSAEQIVAMAAATASFANINVEGAGGAFSRVFSNIERAVAKGGDKLDSFGKIAGISGEEFRQAWAQDAGGAFNLVLKGLNQDLPNLVKNLDELQINNTRDRRVVEALAIQYEKYARILGDTGVAFQEGTALSEAYSYVLDDLATRFQLFLNNVTNTAAVLGGEMAPALISVLDLFSNLLKGLGDFASSDVGGVFLGIAGSILAVGTALLAVRGGLALATASTLAYRQATAAVGITGLASQVRFLGQAWTGVGAATGAAAAKTATAGGKMAGIFGGLRTAGGGLVSFLGGPWGIAIGAAVGAITLLVDAVQKADEAVQEDLRNGLVKGESAILGVTDRLKNMGYSAEDAGLALASIAGDQEAFNKLLGDTNGQYADGQVAASAAEDSLRDYGKALGAMASEDLPLVQSKFAELLETWKESGGTAETLIAALGGDFTTGLKGVAETAGLATDAETLMNIALGETGTQSNLAAGGIANVKTETQIMAENVEAAKEELELLRQELENLIGPGRTVYETQQALSAAFNDASKKIGEYVAENGKAADILTRHDDEAIGLQDTLLKLGDEAKNAAAAIINNGGSVEEASAKYDEGRQAVEFLLDQMGVAPDKAEAWADRMFGPAATIKGYLEAIYDAQKDVNGLDPTIDVTAPNAPTVNGQIRNLYDLARYVDGTTVGVRFTSSGFGSVMDQMNSIRVSGGLGNMVISPGYAGGGFTGRGGKYEPAGVVHKGEYVVPKEYVNQSTGLPYADALGRLQRGAPSVGYYNGGFVQQVSSGVSGPVDLSLASLQALARLIPRQLVANGRVLGEVTNSQNTRATSRGAR